jgi:hypothetical protein
MSVSLGQIVTVAFGSNPILLGAAYGSAVSGSIPLEFIGFEPQHRHFYFK